MGDSLKYAVFNKKEKLIARCRYVKDAINMVVANGKNTSIWIKWLPLWVEGSEEQNAAENPKLACEKILNEVRRLEL